MSIFPVSRLMQPCASATITLTTPLREAAERVLTTGQATLPVVDEDGHFAGIVNESALIRSLMNQSSRQATVAPIVSRHIQSARTDADLSSVLPLFRSAGQTVIPVVDSANAPIGLLHRRDVIRYLLDDGSSDRHKGGGIDPAEMTAHQKNRPHFHRRPKTNCDRSVRDSF